MSLESPGASQPYGRSEESDDAVLQRPPESDQISIREAAMIYVQYYSQTFPTNQYPDFYSSQNFRCNLNMPIPLTDEASHSPAPMHTSKFSHTVHNGQSFFQSPVFPPQVASAWPQYYPYSQFSTVPAPAQRNSPSHAATNSPSPLRDATSSGSSPKLSARDKHARRSQAQAVGGRNPPWTSSSNHLRTSSAPVSEAPTQQLVVSADPNPLLTQIIYSCTECGKGFGTEKGMKQHEDGCSGQM